MKIRQVWHPYWLWEEIPHNMWGDVKDRKDMLSKAVVFTGDHKLYGDYMVRVTNEWKVSCENALTDPYINQKAWVGHAACALALNCPEDIVRKAWGLLTNEQQYLANQKAGAAVQAWKERYIKDKQLHRDLAQALLF